MRDSLLILQSRPRIKKPELVKKGFIPRCVSRPELVKARNQEFSNSFYSSPEWLKLRYQVLSASSGKCSLCGSSGLNVRLHVDHIRPRSKFPALALAFSNLQVLCESCNLGKGAWDQSDWRKRL